MPPRAKASAKRNTNKELGHQHRVIRKRLLAKMQDGEPCWWCGEPMTKNQDLAADHDLARANGGIKASRILHFVCNSQRGDGSHDDQRPKITGKPFTTKADDRSDWCLLAW